MLPDGNYSYISSIYVSLNFDIPIFFCSYGLRHSVFVGSNRARNSMLRSSLIRVCGATSKSESNKLPFGQSETRSFVGSHLWAYGGTYFYIYIWNCIYVYKVRIMYCKEATLSETHLVPASDRWVIDNRHSEENLLRNPLRRVYCDPAFLGRPSPSKIRLNASCETTTPKTCT